MYGAWRLPRIWPASLFSITIVTTCEEDDAGSSAARGSASGRPASACPHAARTSAAVIARTRARVIGGAPWADGGRNLNRIHRRVDRPTPSVDRRAELGSSGGGHHDPG